MGSLGRLALRAGALVILCVGLGLAPSAGARCRSAPGWRLALVSPSAAVAPGGTVLLQLVPAYRDADAVTLPLTTVRLDGAPCRSATPCRARAQLTAHALDLYSFSVPASAHTGAWHVAGIRDALTVAPSATLAAAPTAAPVLATPPVGTARVGSATSMPTFELAAPAPASAVGLQASRGGVSWFMPAVAGQTSYHYGPARCTAMLPGWAPLAAGETIVLAFVGASGDLSPSTTIVAPPQ